MKAPSREQLLNDVMSDLTWKEIAVKYGYSDPRFLRKLANRYSLPKRRVILKPSEETLRGLILDEGMTPRQVAEHLGYGPEGWSNIYKYCRDYGISFDFSVNHELRSAEFSQRQKDICFGSLLGDAYLRPSGNNASLSFTHGERQLDYLRWKYNEFSDFVTMKDFNKSHKEFRGNLPTYSFSTVSHPFLGWAREICYPDGRKKVSDFWLSQLSPLSLAVWYMDDGSINKRYKTIVLCTNSFSAEEHQLLIEYFRSSYGIEAKLEPRRNGQFVLRINSSQSKSFLDIVAPHIPDCMNYKLG
ncbi:MAG: hypothetical protein IKT81_02620 [Clostridia bacterium]|nr:hypothetical protein [Clostridia bacterium]